MRELGRVKIREAVEADRSPVLDFCRNTWPGGDYIADVWDHWLGDRKGRLIVATVGGVPVGIAHGYLQNKDVVWLEGMRVHTSYRGHGIAGKLNKSLTRYGKGRGAKIARLCTGSVNMASQKHAEKVGFNVTKTFQRLDSEKGLRKTSKVTRIRKFSAAHWEWLERRPELDDFGRMYSTGWTWHPLTRESLKNLVEKRHVLLTRNNGALRSCGIFWAEGKRLTLGFTAGDEGGVADQARFLRYILSRKSFERVRALVPAGSSFVGVLENLGFAKSGKVLVYEKRLR